VYDGVGDTYVGVGVTYVGVAVGYAYGVVLGPPNDILIPGILIPIPIGIPEYAVGAGYAVGAYVGVGVPYVGAP